MPAEGIDSLDQALAPGVVVAEKYRLVRQLGAGAMGRVFEAEHLILERPVAIKFVLGVPGVSSVRRRFLREAQTAQALSSEHVLRVFDLGFQGELAFIVMELLDGEDLDSVLAMRGALPISEAVDYILQACLGVAEAHAAGIVHRDIKPSNLFLTRTASGAPLVKVLDFGISKVLEPENEDPDGTAAGALLGSPYYMSPEQLRNPRKVDGRTDVWALAVTLYNLLTNAHPFEGDTISEVTAAIFTDPARPLLERRPDIPEELSAVLAHALEKRPEDRTASVSVLAAELAPFATSSGRLAAQRLSSTVPPHVVASRPGTSRENSHSPAALTATLPAADATAPSVEAPEAPVAPRSSRLWLFALAAALAGVIGWLALRSVPAPQSDRTATEAPAAAASVIPKALPAPRPTPPAPVEVTSATTPSVTPRLSVAPKVREKPARVSPAPAPSASAAKPPKPRLDIDGIPILE